MQFKDIIIADDGGFKASNGDFFVAPSDTQHIQHIVFSNPGDWKQSPIVGFGVVKQLNSPVNLGGINRIKSGITLQLTMDGYKVMKVTAGNTIGSIKIDAKR